MSQLARPSSRPTKRKKRNRKKGKSAKSNPSKRRAGTTRKPPSGKKPVLRRQSDRQRMVARPASFLITGFPEGRGSSQLGRARHFSFSLGGTSRSSYDDAVRIIRLRGSAPAFHLRRGSGRGRHRARPHHRVSLPPKTRTHRRKEDTAAVSLRGSARGRRTVVCTREEFPTSHITRLGLFLFRTLPAHLSSGR